MGLVSGSVVPVLFLLAACRPFEVQRQQVFLRYLPDEDVLDAVLVYEGVGATEENRVESTTEALAAIARGRRHFMIFDWLFDFDLEATLDELRQEPPHPEDEYAEAKRGFLAYERDISVVEARCLLDRENELDGVREEADGDGDGGRLCLLQRIRFAHASRALRMLDLLLNASVLEEMSRKDAEMTGDPSADALFIARARRGGSWVRFDGAALEVSVPMTSELAAVQLKELIESAASSPENGRALGRFLDAVSAFQVTADELRLRFDPAEDGWIRFLFVDERRGYRPTVAERLGREGLASAGDLEAEIQRLKAKP
jgi:hypothetical protein